jgi:HK97 family phage major capsid protein/HK97 family phage prohead protease
MKNIIQKQIVELKAIDEEKRTITAVASTETPDRFGDVVKSNGWELDNFKKNPTIVWGHDYKQLPIAKATDIAVRNNQLIFTAEFPEEGLNPQADTIFKYFKNGFLKAFSVGFIPLEYERNEFGGTTFLKQELLEISAVVVPANQEALAMAVKAVVPYQDLPLADMEREWDAGEAVKRVKNWATTNDEVDFAKYRRAFLWYDSENPELLGSYKLPIADVIDGSLKAVPRAIFAAAAAIQGARGGVDIPDADKERIRNVLSKYYEKMDRTPPWEEEGINENTTNKKEGVNNMEQENKKETEQLDIKQIIEETLKAYEQKKEAEKKETKQEENKEVEKEENNEEKKEEKKEDGSKEMKEEIKEFQKAFYTTNVNGKPQKSELDEKAKKEINTFIRAIVNKDNSVLKDLTGGVDASGGYLVPETLQRQVLDLVVEKYGVVRPRAYVIPNLGSKVTKWTTLTGKPKLTWIEEYVDASNEAAAKIPAGQPDFGRLTLTVHDAGLIVPVTNDVLYDANIDLSGLISGLFAEAQAYEEDFQAIQGTGAPFTGVFNDANVNTKALELDKVVTDITADDLIDLMAMVPARYANGAIFVASRTVAAVLKQIKDASGRYVFDPAQNTIFGVPVVESDVMPAVTDVDTVDTDNDKPILLFGNLGEIMIGDYQRMSVALADQASVGGRSLFEFNESAFRVIIRLAMAIRQPKAFAVLKTGPAV